MHACIYAHEADKHATVLFTTDKITSACLIILYANGIVICIQYSSIRK